jgi:GNAT superfamily N-acetyltransferase
MVIDVSPAEPARDAHEIEALLQAVYVQGGFTDPDRAKALFVASAVFERGRVLVARDREAKRLAGMVIVATASSPARRLARSGESEMHLLAVGAPFRKHGAGGALVSAAVELSRHHGETKMVLWTQSSMTSAHRLYLRHGFVRVEALDFEHAGRGFLVFERDLRASI